jgi:hypothetical protein
MGGSPYAKTWTFIIEMGFLVSLFAGLILVFIAMTIEYGPPLSSAARMGPS